MTYDWTHGSEECGRLGRSLVRVKPEVARTLGFVRSKGQTLREQSTFRQASLRHSLSSWLFVCPARLFDHSFAP